MSIKEIKRVGILKELILRVKLKSSQINENCDTFDDRVIKNMLSLSEDIKILLLEMSTEIQKKD